MEPDRLLEPFATLFVTIDPIGLAPLFLALTSGMDRSERNHVAMRGALTGLGILLLFTVAGPLILNLFGITLPAFRVAGGLLLFWIAFEMIFGKREDRKSSNVKQARSRTELANLAVFPLAIPLIAGPGAISATILLSERFPSPSERLVLIAIVVFVVALCYIFFRIADRIDVYLGETGRSVLTRLLGVILSALAVQFMADGIRGLING
ncbi:MarC family protein [Notoacmeibacter sp. MSK16QG-6]|uniref:MarC family protein n=1 Tax=Notoacmeibacter sp. MSK16QG-6 TaxID=2957982 RepID=UPI00209FC401|nr:MarC family protein [Notoacmeibacter sp. MSK16QG-6]